MHRRAIAFMVTEPRPSARDAVETQLMPRRERSVLCSEPFCGVVLDEPGRCAAHQRDGWARFRASEHGRARATGYDSRWRKVRDRRLRDFPTCEVCHRAESTTAHHVDHQLPTAPDFYSYDAVIAVCDRCHRRLSQRSKTV
jgi:5-methylcytosine-specific restriction endonuclease McrA